MEIGSLKLTLWEFTCITVLFTTTVALIALWSDWSLKAKKKAYENKVQAYLKFRQLSQFIQEEDLISSNSNSNSNSKGHLRNRNSKDNNPTNGNNNSDSDSDPTRRQWKEHPIFKGKKILVLVNPFSGRKESPWIFKHIVKPMLEQSIPGMEIDSIFTQHSNHAREIASSFDLEKYSCLACISGDGMLHQVLNGLGDRIHTKNSSKSNRTIMSREEERQQLLEILKQITLVLIPGGTSNGIAASFNTFDPFTAVKNLVEGKVHSIDLLDITQPNRMKLNESSNNTPNESHGTTVANTHSSWWDIHALAWAILGDYNELVEVKLRWLGTTLRNIIAPVVVITKNKSYRGRISILPAEYSADNKYKYRNPNSLQSLLPSKHASTIQYITQSSSKGNSSRKGSKSDDDSNSYAELFGDISKWRTFEDDVTFFVAMNLVCGASDAIFAPGVIANEGCVDLVIMRKPSRFALVKLFLELAHGTHINASVVEMYKVRALIIEPFSPNSKMDISGEVIPSSVVIVKVHQAVANLTC